MARPADPHRRETILRAATEVFVEQGYSDTRLADIAQRAGVVISTLYLYFSSKEEMVRAIAQEYSTQLVKQIRPVLEHLRGLDDIAELIEIILASAEDHQDQLRVFFLDSGFRGIRARNKQRRASHRREEGTEIIRTLIAQEHIRSYDPAFVIDMLDGFIRWMLRTYTTMEETEKPAFKSFCIQWLSNALLLPSSK